MLAAVFWRCAALAAVKWLLSPEGQASAAAGAAGMEQLAAVTYDEWMLSPVVLRSRYTRGLRLCAAASRGCKMTLCKPPDAGPTGRLKTGFFVQTAYHNLLIM